MNFPTDRIYKFSSFNENSITALATNSVWFSSVGKLNDPFEAMVNFNEPKSNNEKIASYVKAAAKNLEGKFSKDKAFNLSLQRYQENPDDFIKYTDNLVKEAKEKLLDGINSLNVFSTSIDIPNYKSFHYANMLMWAHYGDGFSGFCLRFSAKKLYNSLKRLNESSKINVCLMRYSNQSVEIDEADCLGLNDLDLYKSIQQKHEQWIYEGELRFISNVNGLHKFSPEDLEDIYIGSKMEDGKKRVLLSIIKNYYPHASVYEVKIYKSSYSVIADKINI